MNDSICKSSKVGHTMVVNGRKQERDLWGAGHGQFLDLDGSYMDVFTT